MVVFPKNLFYFGTKFIEEIILGPWKSNYKNNYEIPQCNMQLSKITKHGSIKNVLMN
jgi:hypothetical protein